MKYRIRLNDEDYLRYNIFYATHTKEGKRQTNMMRILCPLFSVLVIMIFIIAGAEEKRIVGEAIALSVLTVIWCIFTPKIRERNIRKNINRLKADGKLPYPADAEIEFQDSMIVERSEQGEVHVKYEDIENIYHEKDYLYIFYNVTHAFLIPYHCLGEDKERVTEFVMKKRN